MLKVLANDLGIKNIRILNKIKTSLVNLRNELSLAEDKVRESFINRLVLFSVVYYSGVPCVDYALFKESIKNIHVFDYMLDDKRMILYIHLLIVLMLFMNERKLLSMMT